MFGDFFLPKPDHAVLGVKIQGSLKKSFMNPLKYFIVGPHIEWTNKKTNNEEQTADIKEQKQATQLKRRTTNNQQRAAQGK